MCCYTKSIVEIDDISRTKRDKEGQKMLTLQKKSANEHHSQIYTFIYYIIAPSYLIITTFTSLTPEILFISAAKVSRRLNNSARTTLDVM